MANLIDIKKRSGLGIFIGSLLGAILVALFLLIPKFGDYKNHRVQYDLAAASAANTKSLADQATHSIDELGNQGTSLDRINLALPSSANVTGIFAYLEFLAKSNNLKITGIQALDSADKKDAENAISSAAASQVGVNSKSVNPTTVANGTSVGTVSINMDVSGPLEGFNGFLTALQKSLRLIDVQSIQVAADQAKGQTNFKVGLKTYYLK